MKVLIYTITIMAVVIVLSLIFLNIVGLFIKERKIYEGKVFAKDCPNCENDMYEVMTNKHVKYYCPTCGWNVEYNADEDGMWRIQK